MLSRRLYVIHRWLGALVGLQLLAWTAGGLVFATHPLDWIKGERGRSAESQQSADLSRVRLSFDEAATRAGVSAIRRMELLALLGRPVYEIEHAGGTSLIDADTGALRSPIDEATAVAIARADRASAPSARSVVRVDSEPPIEYRNKPLPAWRVDLDDGQGTTIWIDATTGAVRARRNDAWRRYDFFWALHTMDWGRRESFQHPLIVIFAALGVVSVGSGFVLWFVRIRRKWRRT